MSNGIFRREYFIVKYLEVSSKLFKGEYFKLHVQR